MQQMRSNIGELCTTRYGTAQGQIRGTLARVSEGFRGFQGVDPAPFPSGALI